MLVNEQESPRAKIRSWLLETESTAKSKPIQPPSAYSESKLKTQANTSPPFEIKTEEQRATHCGRFLSPVSPRRCIAYDKQLISVDHHATGEPDETSEHHEHHVADHSRLGRRLPIYAHDAHLTVKSSQPRKRQRTTLSTSSNLRPASVAEVEDCQHVVGDLDNAQGAGFQRHVRPAHSPAALIDSPNHSALFFSPPKKSANPYERRSRHKTRKDRYDLKKSIPKQRKTPVQTVTRKKSARTANHTVKSGQALIQDYTAPNVSSDRLTLRSRRAAGFFGRGKASSPVKRRGLSDLAFSELAFLNTTRQKPAEVTENTSKEEARKARKAKKAADGEAEISRYFIAGRGREAGIAKAVSDHQNPTNQQHSLREPEPQMMQGPEKAFLGFGTSGAHSASPVLIVEELDARCVPPTSQRDTRSPSRSTSCLTCSRSSAQIPNPRGGSRSSRSKKLKILQHPPCSIASESLLSGDIQLRQDDGPVIAPNHEAIGATTARRLADDDVSNIVGTVSKQGLPPRTQNSISRPSPGNLERDQRLSDYKSPLPNRLSASKAFPSGTLSTGSTNIRSKAATGSHKEVGRAKPMAPPSSQLSANRETFTAIQSTLNALLEACNANFPNAVIKDATPETRSELTKISNVTMEELDGVQHVLSPASRRISNCHFPVSQNNFEPVAQIPDAGPQNASKRFGNDDREERSLPRVISEPPLVASSLYRRPCTTEGIYLQNPYSQTPPIDFSDLAKGHDVSRERQLPGKTEAFRTFQGYVPNMEDSDRGKHTDFDIQGQLPEFEDANMSHTYDPRDERGPVQELGEDWLDNIAQHEFVACSAMHPRTVSTDHERSHHYLNATSPNSFTERYHPGHFQTSDVKQDLDFHVHDHPQIDRYSAGLTRRPPQIEALQKNVIQTRFTSRTYGDPEIEPVGFWKPNRLY